MATKTEIVIDNLKINYLSSTQFDTEVNNNTLNENELYMIPINGTSNISDESEV